LYLTIHHQIHVLKNENEEKNISQATEKKHNMAI
jgi:hypothetical protein